MAAFDRFVDVRGKSDAARLLSELKVDIAVDLTEERIGPHAKWPPDDEAWRTHMGLSQQAAVDARGVCDPTEETNSVNDGDVKALVRTLAFNDAEWWRFSNHSSRALI